MAQEQLVTDYVEVVRSVGSFNEGLDEGKGLDARIAFARAWYYVPTLDAVGPSKFIGYSGMTAGDYMILALDGKETEPRLRRWFEALEPGTPEHAYVQRKVADLALRYGRKVSKAARFGAQRGWRLSGDDLRGLEPTPTSSPEESSAIIEVFVRAFGTLRPSEQSAVAARIAQRQ